MKSTLKRMLSRGLWMPSFVRPLIRLMYKCGVGIGEGMIFLRKLIFVEPVLRSIAEVGTRLRVERLPYIRGKGRLVIGDDVYISGKIGITFMSVDGEEPVLKIGSGSFIGHGSSISVAREVTIGQEVLIAAGTRIYDNDGHPHDAEKRRSGGKISDKEIAPVSIGDGAWIGVGSIILKGADIAEDQIVGAGTVLRRSSENG